MLEFSESPAERIARLQRMQAAGERTEPAPDTSADVRAQFLAEVFGIPYGTEPDPVSADLFLRALRLQHARGLSFAAAVDAAQNET